MSKYITYYVFNFGLPEQLFIVVALFLGLLNYFKRLSKYIALTHQLIGVTA